MAHGAFPRAPLGAVDVGTAQRKGIGGQTGGEEAAVVAVSDAAQEHRVDIEAEAEREHELTVSPLASVGMSGSRTDPAGCELATRMAPCSWPIP